MSKIRRLFYAINRCLTFSGNSIFSANERATNNLHRGSAAPSAVDGARGMCGSAVAPPVTSVGWQLCQPQRGASDAADRPDVAVSRLGITA